jgi:hypothetical protein
MKLHTSLDGFVKELEKRQRDIITRRFGITNTTPTTLAKLGEKYDITRERVRQIEAAGLKELRDVVRADQDMMALHEKCVAHIEKMGGVRRADVLVDDLKFVLKDEELTAPYIDLLFAIVKKPQYHQETADYYAFWYINKEALSANKKFVDKLATVLKGKKEMVMDREKFDQLFSQVIKQHEVQDFVALNFVLNSKRFSVNAYGDFGLSHWPEITPKTVRDKSYLVLKKRGEALHFKDIAEEINKVEFDVKKAHPQTVHNELIKDERFVLVGRGLYSLQEFGIHPGTTKDVLENILKDKGPLHVDTIVDLVSDQRILKRNTIVLNLQDKKRFKKLDGGMYHVA